MSAGFSSANSPPSARSTVASCRGSSTSTAPSMCAARVYACATPAVPKMMRAMPSYVAGAFSVLTMTNPRSARAAAVPPARPTRVVAL